MRMWMLPTNLMCNQHLLGEHSEIHKHKHNFIKKHNMGGRLSFPSQIDPLRMLERHDEIVVEMLNRGMNHKSPYGEQPDVDYLFNGQPYSYKVNIDIQHNLMDLANRCEKCKAKIVTHKFHTNLKLVKE